MLEAALPAQLLTEIEELMRTDNFEYKSDFAKKYYAKGREEGRESGREEFTAHGQIRALLLVLDARGLVVDDEARARIEAERDSETLDRWTRQAATTSTVAGLFET